MTAGQPQFIPGRQTRIAWWCSPPGTPLGAKVAAFLADLPDGCFVETGREAAGMVEQEIRDAGRDIMVRVAEPAEGDQRVLRYSQRWPGSAQIEMELWL